MTAGPVDLDDRPQVGLRRRLANSQHPAILALRRWRRSVGTIRLPLPVALLRALRWLYLTLLALAMNLYRFLVCEPLFRAACSKVGKRMRVGAHIHWVQGKGRLELGDDVTIDGQCYFTFAARYSDNPTLMVGDRTMIGHGCGFVVARQVSIGCDCMLGMGVSIFDSSGHPVDPVKRLAGLPMDPEEVKPVTIGDNVWIGAQATIFPGVTIGNGAVVAARAVVVSNVAPNTLVAGYPARRLQDLAATSRPQTSAGVEGLGT